MTVGLVYHSPLFLRIHKGDKQGIPHRLGRVVSSGCLLMGDDPLGLNPEHEVEMSGSRKAKAERSRRASARQAWPGLAALFSQGSLCCPRW